ncbi:MAG: DNA-3-methyladenine glycosylase [uncultured Thermoleophilia bacterium]|uniref:DNA-3-methyladenine glycosylase n=1 Tax=uncultured Thermoleophilia bacterium TaxID=1497501 RepID=A0A6J4USI8_9ACTN|nr:MAG: DNA-3-methyladenine glycosylase [uncultured Thermoleophilia bacterium]
MARTAASDDPPPPPDGAFRCFGDGSTLYRDYHDREWGRPVTGERELLERVCLEGFQSGLSWLTILRKREAFRAAFRAFEPEALARMGPDDVTRLMGDAGIVRNRRKIEAAIANGRATLELRERGAGLPELVWSFRSAPRPAPDAWTDVPAVTPASAALSVELRRHGFRFVGPTTTYALMQACGLVNDHLAGCVVRDDVEVEQRRVGAVGRAS